MSAEQPRAIVEGQVSTTNAPVQEVQQEVHRASTSGRPEGVVGIKVPYGPGFYVPPPGYGVSTLRSANAPRNDLERADDDGREDERMRRIHLTGSARARRRRPQRAERAERVEWAASMVGRCGSWTLLALVLAAMQSGLLAWFGDKSKAATTIGVAALGLQLYVGTISTLASALHARHRTIRARPFSDAADYRLDAVLNSIAASGAGLVCIGAVLELVALVVFAVHTETTLLYALLGSLAAGLSSTLLATVYALLSNNRTANSPRERTRPASEASSHADAPKPDYGLDSDSDSGTLMHVDRTGRRNDWTQDALERLFAGHPHSP